MTGPDFRFSFSVRGNAFTAPAIEPGLYIVSTPIGNLGDITIRALEVLAACDVIACEDTRTSGVLLSKYGIDRPKVSYTEHNADRQGVSLLRQITEGASVALISDAGTPLVSDPGSRLVVQAVKQGLKIIPLPGASAPLAALTGSGLADGGFRFAGFLPSKENARRRALKSLQQETVPVCYFESPSRLRACLNDMIAVFGEQRHVTIARELTKLHETFHRGTLASLKAEFDEMERIRGEIVIIVEAAPALEISEEETDKLLARALQTMKTKQAAKSVAAQTGKSQQELYKRLLTLKHSDE